MVQVFVRTCDGRTCTIDAPREVSELRAAAADFDKVPRDELRLSVGGVELLDGEELHIGAHVTVFSSLRLLGGMPKKKKKKAYTKPKKMKHKKKKVKLPVLKFYKVNDDGTIERLRRECPSPECGAGIFMAKHKNREYCGRCGLTYVADSES